MCCHDRNYAIMSRKYDFKNYGGKSLTYYIIFMINKSWVKYSPVHGYKEKLSKR